MKDEYQEEYQVAEFVRSDEWRRIRSFLDSQIQVLNSVQALDTTITNELLGQEAKARSMAIKIVLGWIEEIEGIEEQQKQDIVEQDIFLRQ